jgi:hypothetical protein
LIGGTSGGDPRIKGWKKFKTCEDIEIYCKDQSWISKTMKKYKNSYKDIYINQECLKN